MKNKKFLLLRGSSCHHSVFPTEFISCNKSKESWGLLPSPDPGLPQKHKRTRLQTALTDSPGFCFHSV